MARRMKKKLAGLGAVEGEKVEYFVPASIFNSLGKGAKETIAFCMKDVEELVGYVDYQASVAERKATRSAKMQEHYGTVAQRDEWYRAAAEKRAASAARAAKTKAKAGGLFSEMAAEIRKDVAAIRARGITGPIPVCVYRTSGKYGDKALKTAEARANRFHERFHADTRRAEYRANRPHHDCELEMAKVLGDDLDPELRAFSATYWTPRGRAAVEEILARVEEVHQTCYGEDTSGCSDVIGRVNDWFIAKKKPELAASFIRATTAVKKRFSSPLKLVEKACAVPPGSLRGLSKKQKAILLATLVPFVPPL